MNKNFIYLFVLIIIIIYIIILSLVLLTQNKENNIVDTLIEDYNSNFFIPEISFNYKYLSEDDLNNFIRLKGILYSNNLQKMNENALKLSAAFKNSTNWWTREIGVPTLVAYCLFLTNFNQNDISQELLENTIKTYNNPFYRGNSTTNKEEDTNLYHKLSYHLLWYKYVEKNKLQNKVFYDVTMKKNIIDFFNTTPTFNIPSVGVTLKNGLYFNKELDEIGFVYHNGIPYGIGYLSAMIEPLFYISQNYKFNFINTICKVLFERLKIALCYSYSQIRGGGRGITRMRYKDSTLLGLGYLFKINPKFNIGDEYQKQINSLHFTQKIYPIINNYPNTKNVLNYVFMHSFSEGFSFLKENNYIFEFAANSKIYKTETGLNTNDELNYNVEQTKGYINYGTNYTPLFKNYNTENTNKFLLSGQYIFNNTISQPNSATLIKLDNNLYFASHLIENCKAHGIIDTKNGLHQYTLISNNNITYYPFTYVSQYLIAHLIIDDNTIVILEEYRTFTIKANCKLEIKKEILSNCCFVQIYCNITKEQNINISISQTNIVGIWQNIKLFFGVDSTITFNPQNADINPYSTVIYNNKTYIIDTNIGLWSNTARQAIKNNQQYDFSNKSLQRYALID